MSERDTDPTDAPAARAAPPDRTAPADAPVQAAIARRWSPRAFSGREVSAEDLRSLFEAARWAASSNNGQPWRFVVATRADEEGFQHLLEALAPANRAWAQNAPVLMLTAARTTFAHNDAPNPHAWHDVGQAIATLALEATARGIVIHQMAGFDAQKARELLRIPAGFDPVAVVAVGYPGDPDTLPDKLREREQAPRQRRPQAEFVFGGAWDKTWKPEK